MAYIVMAYIVLMAYIDMTCIVTAYIVMPYIIIMACIVWPIHSYGRYTRGLHSYIVMTCIVMAYITMAYSHGLHS